MELARLELVAHMVDQQALVAHMVDRPELVVYKVDQLVLGRPGLEQDQLVSESGQPDRV